MRPSHGVGLTRGYDGDRGATGVARAGELANGARGAPRSVESPGERHRSEVRVSLTHTATCVAHDVHGSRAVHGDIGRDLGSASGQRAAPEFRATGVVL